MQETWERTAPCRDRVDRDRVTKVVVSARHEIVVINPPGEVAVYDPIELGGLMQVLTDARAEALRRRGGF
jgi:hypothetical protein